MWGWQRLGSLGSTAPAPSAKASPPPGHKGRRLTPHKALYSSSFREGEKQIPLETCFHGNQLAIDNVAAVGPPEGEKSSAEIRLWGPRKDSSNPESIIRLPHLSRRTFRDFQSNGCRNQREPLWLRSPIPGFQQGRGVVTEGSTLPGHDPLNIQATPSEFTSSRLAFLQQIQQ